MAAGQLQRIEMAVGGEQLRDGDPVVGAEAVREAVLHVELGPDRDAAAGRLPHGCHDAARIARAILEAAAVLVAAAVVVGREELAQQVPVADVHLEPVEARVDRQPRRRREVVLDPVEVGVGHRARETLGVDAERAGRAERALAGRFRIGEPARVSELDRGFRARGVDRVGETREPVARRRPHPDLILERAAVGGDRAIGERRHGDAACGELAMPVDERVGHEPVLGARLVGRAFHDAVPERDRPEREGRQDRRRGRRHRGDGYNDWPEHVDRSELAVRRRLPIHCEISQ